jgi:AcrR family transcriptional regulator
MARRARVSPDRILAAAALEFAERGFAGARVDRIARRANVNKAMLYYHFMSKDRL